MKESFQTIIDELSNCIVKLKKAEIGQTAEVIGGMKSDQLEILQKYTKTNKIYYKSSNNTLNCILVSILEKFLTNKVNQEDKVVIAILIDFLKK